MNEQTPKWKLAQVIRYKCCNKIFAACLEPYCYTEADWQRDVRKYAKQGHIVEMTSSEIRFGKCECATKIQEVNPLQTNLF